MRTLTSVAAWCCLAVLALAGGCQPTAPAADNRATQNDVPGNAAEVTPVLVGQALPRLILRTVEGEPFDLNEAVAKKPTVLVLYRGGWCMYCNLQLAQLKSIESALVDAGCQIIAISPDRPAKLAESGAKHGLEYLLLSDSKMTAARALGVAFRVDDATVVKYKDSYGIDLEGDSGQTHHQLPVPSAFVIGRDGVIRFAYVNPDYKVRVDPGVLLAAAKAAAAR